MSTTAADPPSPPQYSATAEQILDLAREKIQQRGYNAVSYGDLADELDLTTAAIHYHFPSKSDLGQAVVARYRRGHAERRAAIRERTDALREHLQEYASLYTEILNEGGLCLCGVLSSDDSTLPEAMREEVRQFFAEQEDWLTETIKDGAPEGTGLQGCESPRQAAKVFLAAIEGAMFTTRTKERCTQAHQETIQCLIDSIVAE